MGLSHSPKMTTRGLRLYYDANNKKSYPGSGNVLYDLSKNKENITATTLTTIDDGSNGKVIDTQNCSQLRCTLATDVNHEEWSVCWWIRNTGTPLSNYRSIVRLDDTNNIYFWATDERISTNNYVLWYQKDYNINSWLSGALTTVEEWESGSWFNFGVSHNSGVFRTYVNGDFQYESTQTRDVAAYTDIRYFSVAYISNSLMTGPVMFYDKILTNEEFQQNFNAMRGRFGI